MRKVKVVLPAPVTNLGLGLALALALHVTIEIVERGDDTFAVETSGEGAGDYSTGLRHPVVIGLARVFQKLERAPSGLTIHVDNNIPSGLGSEAAFRVAGVIGANTLFGNPFTREQVLTLAAQVCRRADQAVTAILGGLTGSLLDGDRLIYRSLPLQGLQAIVVVPQLQPYNAPAAPERILFADAQHSLARLPLLVDALRTGDYALLASALDERLTAPLRAAIPGCDYVVSAAKRQGASAVTVSGDGPALIAFAAANHRQIADAMVAGFADADVKARAWVVPVDTQGVVISAAQS